jgi:hypothetical protein
MSKHGLSHSWDVRQEGTRIVVTCRLSHELGHSETVTMEGLADQSGNKNSIQQLGSTVSYLQRYTLKAILGLASVDDDGQQAPPAKETQQAPPNGYMPDERFEQVFPAWKKMLVWNEKEVDDILNAAKNKGIKLSPQQIQRIKEAKDETA